MVVLEEGDNAINRPGRGEIEDVEEAVDVEAKSRKTGTGRVEVGGGLRCKEAEAAIRGDVGLSQAVVVAQVVVARKEGETSCETGPA